LRQTCDKLAAELAPWATETSYENGQVSTIRIEDKRMPHDPRMKRDSQAVIDILELTADGCDVGSSVTTTINTAFEELFQTN
jgi:hypothetical protein